MKRVRCRTQTTFAFGAVEWGADLLTFPVLAGAVVTAERVEVPPPGVGAAFYVSSPAYIENADGSLVTYTLVAEHIIEDVLEGDGVAAAWQAWLGGMETTDVDAASP